MGSNTVYTLQLVSAYSTREKAVKKCVTQVSSTIQKLQERREVDSDNPDILRHLRNEQTKVNRQTIGLNTLPVRFFEILSFNTAHLGYRAKGGVHYVPEVCISCLQKALKSERTV